MVPAALQDASARFAFGRHQLRSFMQRVGTHTVVRGREKTNEPRQAQALAALKIKKPALDPQLSLL